MNQTKFAVLLTIVLMAVAMLFTACDTAEPSADDQCNHNYFSMTKTAATCTKDGVRIFTCASCKDSYTEAIPATGKHSYTNKITTNATCTRDGVRTFTCFSCKDSYTEAIPATGKHNYTSKITTEATCTEDGVKTFTCYMCKDSYTESIAAGHKWTNATCSAPKTCSVCQLTEGNALGHTTNNGICSRCGSVNIKPIVYTGHGNDVITGVNVPYGLYRVIMTNSGKEHFSVVTYDENGDYGDLLANTSGAPFVGEALYRDGEINATNGWSFEIDSDSDWSITIEPINQEITSNIKGYGAVVTDFFSGQGLAAVSMTNSGKEHFSVIIYDDQGNYIKLLANDSGSAFSGKTAVKLDASKKYFLVIDSESEWTVDFGFENNITEYYENKTTSGGTSGDSNSGGTSGDSNKWSYSEASDLNTYANKATTNAKKAWDYAIDAMTASSTYKVLYNRYAVNYAGTAKEYLERMKKIADSNADLTLTDPNENYSTLQEKIDYAYKLCDEIVNLEINSSNYAAYEEIILSITQELSLQCLGIQKLSVDLLGAFTS